jgi:hypothetical protein
MNIFTGKTARKTAHAAARWWAEKLMKGDAAKFQECLYKKILSGLQESKVVYLENDYDPRDILLDAVRETVDDSVSGVMFSGDGIFPQKHATAIRIGSIKPKEGYGNWTDEIVIE